MINTNKKNASKKESKKAIYARYGIEYKNGKILSPVGWITEPLKEGNSKTGKMVYTWSILPGTGIFTAEINGTEYSEKGSCCCDCVGCYAKTGFYRMANTEKSLLVNTVLVNRYIDFLEKAIRAQLETIGSGEIRIHAAGDFNTKDPENYTGMWHRIAKDFASFIFWTYTKVKKYETLFDDLKNANIVKSVIPGIGVNYGHCDYIINACFTLRSLGKSVYICRCGIDKNQHCEGCKVCSSYDYVLFIEHSTAYKAEQDPLYDKLCEIVNNQ